jgi:hypothetical protein
MLIILGSVAGFAHEGRAVESSASLLIGLLFCAPKRIEQPIFGIFAGICLVAFYYYPMTLIAWGPLAVVSGFFLLRGYQLDQSEAIEKYERIRNQSIDSDKARQIAPKSMIQSIFFNPSLDCVFSKSPVKKTTMVLMDIGRDRDIVNIQTEANTKRINAGIKPIRFWSINTEQNNPEIQFETPADYSTGLEEEIIEQEKEKIHKRCGSRWTREERQKKKEQKKINEEQDPMGWETI